MGFSLKILAEMCIEAEILNAITGLDVDSRFLLKIEGKKTKEKVHILSGGLKQDLEGLHLVYYPDRNQTLVLVKCKDVRIFLAQGGWNPEMLVEEEWITNIKQKYDDNPESTCFINGGSNRH